MPGLGAEIILRLIIRSINLYGWDPTSIPMYKNNSPARWVLILTCYLIAFEWLCIKAGIYLNK